MRLGEAEEAALRAGASALGVVLEPGAIERFGLLLDELDRWRERMNLVSVGSREEVIERHVVDSLAAVPLLLAEGPGIHLADLGSGAGFPGLPIAIVAGEIRVTLVEARRKRANFLRSAIRRLGRERLDVLEKRVEELAAPPATTFDAVTTRATFPAERLPEVAAPLLRDGGLLVAFTTARAPRDEESASGLFEPGIAHPYRLRGEAGALQLTSWRRRG